MISLNKVHSISCPFCVIKDGNKMVSYRINARMEDEALIEHDYNFNDMLNIVPEIVDESSFSKNYKLVLLSNGLYTYVNRKNHFVGHTYDFATDFNEHGYAMACKDGKISWINTDFEYLTVAGTFSADDTKFNGFDEVHDFCEGPNYLSRVVSNNNLTMTHYFFDTRTKKFVDFLKFNNDCWYIDEHLTSFSGATDINKMGWAYGALGRMDVFIFAKGYYVPVDYFINRFIQSGALDEIKEEIDYDYGRKQRSIRRRLKK